MRFLLRLCLGGNILAFQMPEDYTVEERTQIDNPEVMTYALYQRLRKEGRLKLGINPSNAVKVVPLFSQREQYIHNFWSWVFLLSIPAFICLGIFYRWWAGAAALVLVTFPIPKGLRGNAASTALQELDGGNEALYLYLRANGMLIYRFVQK